MDSYKGMIGVNNSIVVQRATKADVIAISRILSQSWKAAFGDFFSLDELNQIASEKRFFSILENVIDGNKGELRVAMLDNTPVGQIFWVSDPKCGKTEIISLFTLPQVWGQGVGEQLLLQAEAEIQNGLIELWTFKKNVRARRFYEKMGYTLGMNIRKSDFAELLEVQYTKRVAL